jgi:hypothetical protein
MLFMSGRQEAEMEPLFGSLEEKLRSVYTRPYLAQGSAERALLMLNALLEVCPLTVPSVLASSDFEFLLVP